MVKTETINFRIYPKDLQRAKLIAAHLIMLHPNRKATQPEVFRELLDVWEQEEAKVKP